ncbi:MAG: hypothetical protein GC165_04505 [Armatimonadetes bacterium]|nr:hypothetical protein [Armatimonadota bacterium]
MLSSLIAAVALAQTPVQTPVQVPSFSQTVLQDFQTWDADHDGTLTQAEVDKAALDPKFHGADAAALAALHRWLIAVDGPAPTLTKDWFQNYKPVVFRATKGSTAQEKKEQRKAFTSNPGSLQGTFVAGYRKLSRMTQTPLFADSPELSDIRQGGLSDCYMLAPLGALVHRNPSDVKNMIVPNSNGYTVKFADGQTVQVSLLTDTELAMVGSSIKEGLWIRVMEKAYGTRKIADGETKVATDSMHGGNSGVAGKAFTGHKFKGIKLIGDFQKEVSTQTLDAKMAELRTDIPKAAAEHRLMTAGTPKKDMPKSISPNHAYAVFGYDAKTDRITLWNPHGNDFTPKGPEGPTNGYKIDDGVFSMPLDMFVRTFGNIQFEQGE